MGKCYEFITKNMRSFNKEEKGKMRMDNQKERNISQWENELTARVDQIEENSQDIKAMTKRDYIVAGIVTVVCLLAVIAGAFI